MMTRLSVNINKVALIRNARGANYPDLYKFALDCERYGAQGITVHPRPDERHIKYSDVPILRDLVRTEFNIEGNPTDDFMALVMANPPHQCTLVPDAPDALTSDSGWNTVKDFDRLKEVTAKLKSKGIRVSIFLDPDPAMIEGAANAGVDRIELYTGGFAKTFEGDKEAAVKLHRKTAKVAQEHGLGVNAGHDLNLSNLRFYKEQVEGLLEVSIGHALTVDALYFGLENAIQMYLNCLK